jgi:hypothetical protein
MVKVPHVAMANLIAGKRVVPELIQHDFTATNIVQHLSLLLPDGPARESMMMELGSNSGGAPCSCKSALANPGRPIRHRTGSRYRSERGRIDFSSTRANRRTFTVGH